jgi:hypothetical protein
LLGRAADEVCDQPERRMSEERIVGSELASGTLPDFFY